MKLENNWTSKTLESLDQQFREEPKFPSHLVTTCQKLRKKQLKDFEIEDLRIMIGQDIGLDYLIPLAIEKLKVNILAEGDFYEGDLLENILTCDKEYWLNNTENWSTICELFNENKSRLKSSDNIESIKSEWFNSFSEFESFNK